jgi:hypothetical protein
VREAARGNADRAELKRTALEFLETKPPKRMKNSDQIVRHLAEHAMDFVRFMISEKELAQYLYVLEMAAFLELTVL